MKIMLRVLFLLSGALLASAAHAATLTGTIKTAEGEPMHGVMVRVTDDTQGVSESVYTDDKGVYRLVTQYLF